LGELLFEAVTAKNETTAHDRISREPGTKSHKVRWVFDRDATPLPKNSSHKQNESQVTRSGGKNRCGTSVDFSL